MANSEVERSAAASGYSACQGSGLYTNAGTRAACSGGDSGRFQPLVCEREFHSDFEGCSMDRDPDIVLRSLVGCGLDVGLAAGLLDRFYQVKLQQFGASSATDLVSENQSQSTATSTRALRYQRWREKALLMPEEPGYCYLHVVRFARRKHLKHALGYCPRLQDFISALVPDDLDSDAIQRVGVYRIPVVGSMQVKYHFAYSCDEAQLVGSFSAFLASMLRQYPSLNKLDFGIDDQSLSRLPMVGTVGILPQVSKKSVSFSDEVIPQPVSAVTTVSCRRADDYDSRSESSGVTSRSQTLFTQICSIVDTVNVQVPGEGLNIECEGITVYIDSGTLLGSGMRTVHAPRVGVKLWLFEPGSVDLSCTRASRSSEDPWAIWMAADSQVKSMPVRLLRSSFSIMIQFSVEIVDLDLNELWREGMYRIGKVDSAIKATEQVYSMIYRSDNPTLFRVVNSASQLCKGRVRVLGGSSLVLDDRLDYSLFERRSSMQIAADMSTRVKVALEPMIGRSVWLDKLSIDRAFFSLGDLTAMVEICAVQKSQRVELSVPQDGLAVWIFQPGIVDAPVSGSSESMSFCTPQVYVKSVDSTFTEFRATSSSTYVVLRFGSRPFSITDQELMCSLRDSSWLHVSSIDLDINRSHFLGYSNMRLQSTVDRYGLNSLLRLLKQVFLVVPFQERCFV